MGSIDADATRPRGFRQNIHRMLADLDPGVAHNGLKLYEIDAFISWKKPFFPRARERVSERMSAAEHASKASSAGKRKGERGLAKLASFWLFRKYEPIIGIELEICEKWSGKIFRHIERGLRPLESLS